MPKNNLFLTDDTGKSTNINFVYTIGEYGYWDTNGDYHVYGYANGQKKSNQLQATLNDSILYI